jgi:predicted dehydrogenase/nucleoside-diphosphate-sugar epimerase
MVIRKLEVSVIGCGKMGINHLKAIKNSILGEVVAVADPIIEPNRISEILGKPIPIFRDAEDLLKKVKPEVVHVVTPPDTHYEVGKMALENGAHVFIEKPFVPKATQAEELVRIAQSRGLKIFAGHQLLAHSATVKAEGLVRNIGEIVHVESYFSFRKVRKSLSAVDQAIDILPHPTYTLLHFMKKDNGLENNFLIKTLDAEADGEIRAIIDNDGLKGFLVVSLQGRPVDSYLKIVGTNGSVYIDYVRGVVINLSGSGADAVSAITNPYRQGWQIAWKSTKAFIGLAMKKNKSYEGLPELIENFYQSISEGKKPLISPESIIATVKICERIGTELKEKERIAEGCARNILEEKEKALPARETRGTVLVTGGNGFLGRVICRELRLAEWSVKSISRSLPRFSERDPGVEYEALNLAEGITPDRLKGLTAVIHCAAETSGGKDDHQRNSLEATRKVIEASAAAGIKKFIHMSSIAVLKPGRKARVPLDESAPVDLNNPSRGPYVWGKAQSEEIVGNMSKQLGLDAKIIRLGPLVDFNNFDAPGRLGREVGSYFIVMGSKKSRLSVCDVQTVAKVVRYYLADYQSAPLVLNLIEPGALQRKDLIEKLFKKRKDLKALYVPSMAISVMSVALYGLQRVFLRSRKPLDIAAAFSSEQYKTDLAEQIIAKTSVN